MQRTCGKVRIGRIHKARVVAHIGDGDCLARAVPDDAARKSDVADAVRSRDLGGAYPTPPGPSKSSCRNPLYPFDGTTMYCGSAFMSPERAESAACCAGVYLPGSVDADPEDEFVVGACPNVDGWPV